MSIVSEAIKELKKAQNEIFSEANLAVFSSEAFSMPKVREASLKVEGKYGGNPKEIDPILLEDVLNKLLNDDRDFSFRELKRLPFVIFFSRCNLYYTTIALSLLDLTKERILKNLFQSYLSSYDNSEKTRIVFNSILKGYKDLEDTTISNSFNKRIVKSKSALLVKDSIREVASLIAKNQSVEKTAMDLLGPLRWIRSSNFFLACIKYCYESLNIPLKIKMLILDELYREKENFNKNSLFQSIATNIIPAIDIHGYKKEKSKYQKKCIEIFLELFRYPSERLNKWGSVDERIKKIFLKWTAETNLELFFGIIRNTAVDSQWEYRYEFWKSYLPHITNTWVYLGAAARDIAKQIDNKINIYGTLTGANSNQSIFVFQIGEYVFLEWSHNGALQAWHKNDAYWLFGEDKFSRNDIQISPIKRIPHIGRWQNEIKQWLKNNCNIGATKHGWRSMY